MYVHVYRTFSRPLFQTMAIATLAVCYNNPNVFTGVVKIRKGQAVTLMMESTNMTHLQNILTQFAEEVRKCICSVSDHLRHVRVIIKETASV